MADQRADFEKKATVRDEKQYEDVVGALMEVVRDMGLRWTLSEVFNILLRHEWVGAPIMH